MPEPSAVDQSISSWGRERDIFHERAGWCWANDELQVRAGQTAGGQPQRREFVPASLWLRKNGGNMGRRWKGEMRHATLQLFIFADYNIAGGYLQVHFSKERLLFDSQSLVCLWKTENETKASPVLAAFCFVQKCQRKWLVRWIMGSNKNNQVSDFVNCKTARYKNKPTARRRSTKFWSVVSLFTILGKECAFQQPKGWKDLPGHLNP